MVLAKFNKYMKRRKAQQVAREEAQIQKLQAKKKLFAMDVKRREKIAKEQRRIERLERRDIKARAGAPKTNFQKFGGFVKKASVSASKKAVKFAEAQAKKQKVSKVKTGRDITGLKPKRDLLGASTRGQQGIFINDRSPKNIFTEEPKREKKELFRL